MGFEHGLKEGIRFVFETIDELILLIPHFDQIMYFIGWVVGFISLTLIVCAFIAIIGIVMYFTFKKEKKDGYNSTIGR